MKVALVNVSNLLNSDVSLVVRAINRQLKEDFAPEWSMWATLRQVPRELAKFADAVIYLADTSTNQGVLGYHAIDADGVPFGYVFTELAQKLGEHWSVTLSHETLELVLDSTANAFAAGPHPTQPRTVLHWWEACDAVQARTYQIDGVHVSDFVLPWYFTTGEEKAKRNAFLGPVKSFGVAPGGYVGFYDPQTGDMDVHFADKLARDRMEIKGAAAIRRSVRYRNSLK